MRRDLFFLFCFLMVGGMTGVPLRAEEIPPAGEKANAQNEEAVPPAGEKAGAQGEDAIQKALDALSEEPPSTPSGEKIQASGENAAVQESSEGQDEPAPAAPAAGETQAKPDDGSVGAPPSQQTGAKQIIDIQIRGNKIVSTGTILSKIQSRKGSALVQETVNADLKRLYAAGFFEDIKMEVEEKPSGFVLIIAVIEKPIVSEIRIKGSTSVKEEKLRKAVKLIEGQILDRQAVKQGVEEIRKIYSDKGYRFVDVQSTVDVDINTKEAIITITITEGEEYRIKSIKFEGVKAFKENKLRKLMKVKKKNLWFFRKGVFNEDKFQKDLERVRLYYQQEGYLDVKAEPKFDYDKPKKFMFITLLMDEGRHYVTGAIKIEGNRLFPEAEIWDKLEMLPGLTYSQYYLSKDVEAIRDYYQEQGYMDARVIPDVQMNKETGKVDVAYQIEEGDLYFVQKVVVRGNTKTKDIVIRRELRIRPGERFDGGKIKKSKQRLENLNYFEEVTYDTEPTDTPNRKDLVFRVKEKRTGELSFGGGISSVDNLVGFAEIAQRNFDLWNWPRFTGGGQSISLGARIGTISQNFNFNFTEPYLFNKPISTGVDLYSNRREDENVDWNEDRLGSGLTVSRLFKDVFRLGGGYTFERVKLHNIEDGAPQIVQDFSGSSWLSRLKAFTAYDTRDNPINPMRGQLASLSGELVGTFLGGDESYFILQAAYTHYWTLFKKHLLEAKARVGTSQELGGSDTVPVYDRFYAGGLGTVRGFGYRRVSPLVNNSPVGGLGLAVVNLEYSVPIPIIDGIRLAAFVDAGEVSDNSFDFGFDKVAISTGPGLKIKTPIGPLAFYYGFPIANADEDNRNGRFEFSLSRAF